jgi:hypothetical protein
VEIKRKLKWLLWLVPVFFIIFLVVLFQFQASIYQGLLVPLSQTWWRAQIVINSVSQEIYFALVLLIVAVTGFGVVMGLYLRAEASGNEQKKSELKQVSRARYWTELIYVRNPIQYTRELTNNEVRRLLLNHLGFDTDVDRDIIEDMIKRGEIQVPPEIVPYLSKRRHEGLRIDKKPSGLAALFDRYSQRLRKSDESDSKIEPIDPQLSNIVSYLESQLEVRDDTGR